MRDFAALLPGLVTPQPYISLPFSPYFIRCTARYLLVIEKDAIFQALTQDRLFDGLPCVMVTAKGMPDLATRAFCSKLVDACPGLMVRGYHSGVLSRQCHHSYHPTIPPLLLCPNAPCLGGVALTMPTCHAPLMLSCPPIPLAPPCRCSAWSTGIPLAAQSCARTSTAAGRAWREAGECGNL